MFKKIAECVSSSMMNGQAKHTISSNVRYNLEIVILFGIISLIFSVCMEISKGNNLPVRSMLVRLSWGIAAIELHLMHKNSLCISGTLTSWWDTVFRRWLRLKEVRGHSFSGTIALERELFPVKTELENGICRPETESASNLNLDFQPTEVRENNCCVVYATQPVALCYGNLSKVRDNHHRSEGDELIS